MPERIILSHGDGGRRTRELIDRIFLKKYSNPILSPLYDSGFLELLSGDIAFTTDSYVVTPPFFPGGDIGKLAICGTVNDLSVCGAKPIALSCSLILEEGFPLELLEKIADSIAKSSAQCEVPVVCGDTKVVEKGKGDGIFINTSGIGVISGGWRPRPENIKRGDRVLITGTMGDHGIAVLVARKEMMLKGDIQSDVAPLSPLLLPLINKFGENIKFLRDPTRGGVGVTLNEIAGNVTGRIILDESSLPVRTSVRGVCEILGFDPLYLANEGKAIIIADESISSEVLQYLKNNPLGKESALIGEIGEGEGPVMLKTSLGGMRVIDYPVGEQLPRIC
ncbi:MAG: hydrogenase expression/formation protein HypE [Deltaproteobacteria bacterium]|nr:hydrogenase expression/formation protein HypE [Deltaproteobacteria bacterium]NIS77528.1 hydrogenase expression/formation protein HypE [Deltaproteobacteria bacterium]